MRSYDCRSFDLCNDAMHSKGMVLQRFWQSSVQLAKSSINFFLAPSLSFARENPQPVWMECTGGRISGVDWAGLSGLLMYGGWNFMGSGHGEHTG